MSAPKNRPLRLFFIAGEASGDRLGAPLIHALRRRTPIEIAGIGGEQMQAAGLSPLFPSSDLAVMGLTEVLPRLRLILRRLREAAAAVDAFKPDALITIDSPAFSLRVARKAKAARPDLRTIHYVAPSVWAWRPRRAREMAAYVDHVLALLPFEPPYMTAEGMTCDFVGHPVVDLARPAAGDIAAFRAELGGGGVTGGWLGGAEAAGRGGQLFRAGGSGGGDCFTDPDAGHRRADLPLDPVVPARLAFAVWRVQQRAARAQHSDSRAAL